MVNKSTDFVGSLAKGLRVIEAFQAEQPRLSITDVAQAAELDRATARRCLLTLVELGYAEYDGKFFALTPRVLRLGVAALASMPLPQIVQPWLDQLSDQVGQSCSVSVLEGAEILYVARAAQRRVMSIGLMPGSRLPAFCTSMGRVLLAALPRDEARSLIESSDLAPRTAHSLTDISDLMQELDRVRRQGYALVDQEVEIGLRALSVPLLNQRGETVAALNIGLAAIQSNAAEVVSGYLSDMLRVQAGLKRVLQ
ncbi:MAG: helix-turn-helix domain-containing protein [Rhodobacteraceae bacterium]|nr:helix-turn-helix domain-containing protein [Paracoccaceae bacterium]